MCAKVLVLKVEGIGAVTFSESYIGLESLYLRWREVWREAQFFQAVKRAMQAAVLADGFGLVEVDVGVAAQLVKRKLVDVELSHARSVHCDILQGGFRNRA